MFLHLSLLGFDGNSYGGVALPLCFQILTSFLFRRIEYTGIDRFPDFSKNTQLQKL